MSFVCVCVCGRGGGAFPSHLRYFQPFTSPFITLTSVKLTKVLGSIHLVYHMVVMGEENKNKQVQDWDFQNAIIYMTTVQHVPGLEMAFPIPSQRFP